MPDHHANRRQIIQVLHEELVGPCPSGEEIDCTHAIRLAEPGEFFRPHHQRGSGEEILGRDSPINRYGVGVLYPLSTPVDSDDADDTLVIPDDVITVEEEADHRTVPTELSPIHERISGEDLDDDFDISLTNALRPSSLGVSFLAILPPGGKIVVDVAGGRYRRKDVFCPDQTHPRSWWLRSPVALQTIW